MYNFRQMAHISMVGNICNNTITIQLKKETTNTKRETLVHDKWTIF